MTPSRAWEILWRTRTQQCQPTVESVDRGQSDSRTVDGKQQVGDAGGLEMQDTANKHGKQLEQDRPPPNAQNTTQRNVIQLDDGPLTHIHTAMPTRRHTDTASNKTLPDTSVLVQQVKTKYVIGAKGLSELQLSKACDKAFIEVWNDMGIVANQQYSIEARAAFTTTVYEKACRIIEAKRRRCARQNRRPKVKK